VHLFGFYAVALLTSYLVENVRRAEAALAEQRDSLANLEAFHRDVVQSLSTGIVTTDLAGRITSVNRAAQEILGRPAAELLGLPLEALGLFDHREWLRLAELVEVEGRTLRAEGEVRRSDTRIALGYNLSRLTDAGGTVAGTILIFQDLTRVAGLQEELRLKDRMAAVGELASPESRTRSATRSPRSPARCSC
jgi:two-component system, NtrC family, sensor histidine kinase PilS